MPCYSPENVNAQRGEGVFDASIAALQLLNRLGYGRRRRAAAAPRLQSATAPFSPARRPSSKPTTSASWREHFGIVFNRLYTITNLPIARFASWLRHEGKYEEYLESLVAAFNPATVEGLMCRNTINVSWRGEVYDCDFNQMLKLPLAAQGRSFSGISTRRCSTAGQSPRATTASAAPPAPDRAAAAR